MEDAQFRRLLDHLGLSWPGYRKVKKGVKKRIGRHMRMLGCPNIDAYLLQIGRCEKTRRDCERLLTVSISRFFRDKGLWEVLEEKILPELINRNHKIHVWSAGCACGEEAYSLKIVWDRLKSSCAEPPELEILATDINPTCIERAREGLYPPSSLKDLPEKYRSLYFRAVPDGSLYAVDATMKTTITWKIQSLFADPPRNDFHLIFLRNSLLTYYREKQVKKAITDVARQLRPAGYFIVGSHERLVCKEEKLAPSGLLPYIYIKKG